MAGARQTVLWTQFATSDATRKKIWTAPERAILVWVSAGNREAAANTFRLFQRPGGGSADERDAILKGSLAASAADLIYQADMPELGITFEEGDELYLEVSDADQVGVRLGFIPVRELFMRL